MSRARGPRLSGLVSPLAVLAILAVDTPAPADDAAPVRPTSTVQRLATTLHDQLANLMLTAPRATMDVAVCTVAAGSPRAPGAAASGSERFTARLESVLSARLERDGYRSVVRLAHPDQRLVREATDTCTLDVTEATRRSQERGAEALVHVVGAVQGGRLLLEGTLIRTDRSLWRDLARHRAATPGPAGAQASVIGQVFASARLDAELRFYLGLAPTPPSRRTATVVYESTGEVLAMAVGDVDGDDLDEVTVLGRRALEVIALGPERRGRLAATLTLDSLAPALTASRDPVGTLALVQGQAPGHRIALRASDYAAGMIVSWDGERFGLPESLADYPIDSGIGLLCATVLRGRNTYEARVVPCSAQPAPRPEVGFAPFWSVSYANVLAPDGGAFRSVGLATADARLIVTSAGQTHDLGPSGSAVWVGDLDDDGVVEIVHSAASGAAEPDRLTIATLPTTGPRELWASRPIPGAIVAIAAGDPDGDGVLEALFAERTPTGARIWLVDG